MLFYQWSLVCDREWIPGTITTIQMCGLLVGALVMGQLADIFGRRRLLYLAYSLLLAVSLGSAFVNSWQLFAVFRFFIGALVGSKCSCTVIHTEIIILCKIHLICMVMFVIIKFSSLLEITFVLQQNE